MAVTGTQVFKRAMAKIDELTSSGVVTGSATSSYVSRAIEIINGLLNETLNLSENSKTIIHSTWSTYPTFGLYSIIPLPTDFSYSQGIEEYPFSNDNVYYVEGKELYILTDYVGQVKLMYMAKPTEITTLTDTLTTIDNVANTTIVYGLIAELLATENPELSNLYQQKYEESKISNRPKSKGKYAKTKDKYNSTRGL